MGKAFKRIPCPLCPYGAFSDADLEALDAMGFPKDKLGRYYHRWDRLPKELQEQINRKPKAGKAED